MNNNKKLILREYSRRSFYNFFKLFWSQVETAKFVDNFHIELICNTLQKRYEVWDDTHTDGYFSEESLADILINLPPGSSKSLIVSVFYPAWIWLRMPSAKIITASYSHKIAEELSGKSLRLMQSKLYQSISTFTLTSQAINNIKNSKNGQRFVTSITGAVTGIHGDIIICDDINSPQSIFSEAERENTRKFIQEILPSRKTDLKRSYGIYVQQRLHNDDATGILLKGTKKMTNIVIPAIDQDGESFFPARFPLEHLNFLREQLGSISFNAQYLQKTQDDQGGIIKKDWLKFDIIDNDSPLIYFMDSAYGGQKADYNAIVGVRKIGNYLYVMFAEQNKYEFPELINWIKKNIPSNSKLYVEGKASGKSIIQTLKRETNLNVIETQPKGSKLERKHAVSPFFESGRVIIDKHINNKESIVEQLIFDQTANDDLMDVIIASVEQLLKTNKGNYSIR